MSARKYFVATGVEPGMHRRTAAVVVLVAALLLAGCSGATDDGSSGTDPAGSAGATPTPGPPVYELPLDGEAVSTNHEEALSAAGSFTAETDVSIVEGSSGESVTVVATSAVDLERGTMLVDGTVGGTASQTTYVGPDGTAYQRLETGSGEVQYQQLPDAPDATGYFQLPVATLVEEANFTYAGRDRVAGTSVAVYEVTDLESLVAPVQASEVPDASVNAFEVRMAISDDGLIRQFDYRVEAEIDDTTRTVAMSIVFRDVGTTTVEPPDWLDEAR